MTYCIRPVHGVGMTKPEAHPKSKSPWRSASQMSVLVEDRFRFALVVLFIGLGLLGTGGLFIISDGHARTVNYDAADVAVNRWLGNYPGGYGQLFSSNGGKFTNTDGPSLIEPNRILPTSLLPESLTRSNVTVSQQLNGETIWIINQHHLLDKGITLMLSEREYPELRVARESLQFQRWLVGAMLLILLCACTCFFFFNKHYIFRPLNLLREALLNRRLTEVARVKHTPKSKIIIERLEERSRFPLENFETDEFGQIALILEEQDRRQKSIRLDWLKSFNTINEPIAIFDADGKLCHINMAMDEFLDELGISSDLVSGINSTAFINSFLQLDETIANRLHRVLNQTYPRIFAQSCTIEFPDGQRIFRYSIATISNHGERFAVFSLVKQLLIGQNQSIEDFILEQTNNQLKVIHKIQSTIKDAAQGKDETVIHLCDALVDNIHSLLEVTNSLNPSIAAHKVEFNMQQFFRELEESLEGIFQLNIEFERNLPSFVVGDPTHLRQFLKGVFQSFQETNSINTLLIVISYNTSDRTLGISICSKNGSAILRDPSLNLFVAHYSPILSIKSALDDELQADEYLRVSLAAPAGINRVDSLELDLSNRQLPKTLVVVSDEVLPDDILTTLDNSEQFECKLLTPSETLETDLTSNNLCLILFINNSQKLKEKQIQKVINYSRSQKVPSILLSQQPRRGESLTALRLGFVSYLTLPLEQEELHKLLILTMNKAVRESVGKLGLLTKHTVRDIIPSLGKVLLGNISKEHLETGDALAKTLKTMGFRVTEATTVHSFFEFLHKGNFEYILCSNELSTGLKRRIQIGLKGTPCVVFGTGSQNSQNKTDDNKVNQVQSQGGWINIDDPNDPSAIKSAFEFAAANELNLSKLKFAPDGDEPDSNGGNQSSLDMAI